MTSVARYCLYLFLEFWVNSKLGKAMSVMITSSTQVVQPTYSNKRKRCRHIIQRRSHEKSMEKFAAEVQELFQAPLQEECLLELSIKLQEEYRASLQSSKKSMLPSYQHTLPTGRERGDYLALDVGGSTFRCAIIRLGGKLYDGEGLQARRVRSFAIDEKIRQLKGQEFFDWMAERIGEMLGEYNYINGTTDAKLEMGLAWSFPVEQTSPCTGRLLTMGKGFWADYGLENQDLSELVMRSCRSRGLNVEMCAIVNDGAATLLAQAYRDTATRMSLILGTGMNAAIFLPVSALGDAKFGTRTNSWHEMAKRVVVNCELSMFGRQVMPTTKWDEDLNATHIHPDYQPLEYLITGRYLGEIVRLILLDAISTSGLFDGQIPGKLDEAYAFETKTLATFESDRSERLVDACTAFTSAHPLRRSPKLRELQFIRDIGRLASRRAAAYLATALHALWAVRTASEDIAPGDASHVTIACDGSMAEKYPKFRQRTQRYLDRLCLLSGASEGTVTLEMAPDASIFGAAVAASCAG